MNLRVSRASRSARRRGVGRQSALEKTAIAQLAQNLSFLGDHLAAQRPADHGQRQAPGQPTRTHADGSRADFPVGGKVDLEEKVIWNASARGWRGNKTAKKASKHREGAQEMIMCHTRIIA